MLEINVYEMSRMVLTQITPKSIDSFLHAHKMFRIQKIIF